MIAVLGVVAACGFSPQFGEGSFGCADGGGCPPGFTCGTDDRCYEHLPADATPANSMHDARMDGTRRHDSSRDGPVPRDSSMDVTAPHDSGAHDSGAHDSGAHDSGAHDSGARDASSGCGTGCATGQRCVAGACVCDGTSCTAGCCSGTTCMTPPSASFCGTGGNVCSGCPAMKADGCSAAGQCQCGGGPACTTSKKCMAGACM